MTPANSRPLLWSQSSARRRDGEAPGVSHFQPFSRERTPKIGEDVLRQLGLAGLIGAPVDPRLLIEHLKADDQADAAIGSEEFQRGIRRAVRLGLAKSAGLHRRAGKTWVQWVNEHFLEVGYETYQRFRVAGELQVGLLSRGLPPLVSTYQSRALAPFLKHPGFWDALSGGCL